MSLDYRYELTDVGDLPIKVSEAKAYLKIDGDNDTDNEIIQGMIRSVVQWGEQHTGRDFRANTWKLFLDCFEDRILLRKSPVSGITSVKYTLLTVLTTVVNTVYQFKAGYQFSEVLLRFDQVWPSDGDQIEAGIEIIFVTKIPRHIEQYKIAALEHLAYLYENRGDCKVDEAAMASGAIGTYGSRIARV